jgi:hypothetical protein
MTILIVILTVIREFSTMSQRKRLGKPPSERRGLTVMQAYIPESRRTPEGLAEATSLMCAAIKATHPQSNGEKACVACVRVGDLRLRALPAGYRLDITKCVMCDHDLWISSDTKEAIERKGMTVRAVCYSGCDWRPAS